MKVLAEKLFELSLDMDYMDYMDTAKTVISEIENSLSRLAESPYNDSLLQILEKIADI